MNKKSIIAVATLFTLVFPLYAFAAPDCNGDNPKPRGSFHIDVSKLNDKQKSDFQAQMLKMLNLKKETTQKMIDNGAISKEEGEIMLRHLEKRISDVKAGNFDFKKPDKP